MNKRRIIISISILTSIAVVFLLFYFRKTTAFKKFFVDKICEENVLDHYLVWDSDDEESEFKKKVLNNIELYEKISNDFHKYNIKDSDMAKFARKPVYPYIFSVQLYPITLAVINKCGSEYISTERVGLFVSDMFIYSKPSRAKLRSQRKKLMEDLGQHEAPK
jgi:hypothetical protein